MAKKNFTNINPALQFITTETEETVIKEERVNELKKEEIYSLKEICTKLKVSQRTAYRYIESGKLKAFKVGNGWRVYESDLVNFLNR